MSESPGALFEELRSAIAAYAAIVEEDRVVGAEHDRRQSALRTVKLQSGFERAAVREFVAAVRAGDHERCARTFEALDSVVDGGGGRCAPWRVSPRHMISPFGSATLGRARRSYSRGG